MRKLGVVVLSIGVVALAIGALGTSSNIREAAAMSVAVGGQEGGCYCNESYEHPYCTTRQSSDPVYTCTSCTNIQYVPTCCFVDDEGAYCHTDGGGPFNCGQTLGCKGHDQYFDQCWDCYLQQSWCATGWKCMDI